MTNPITAAPQSALPNRPHSILREVQRRGDAAVLGIHGKVRSCRHHTANHMRIAADAIDRVRFTALASAEFLRALDVAIGNIRRYQEAMLARENRLRIEMTLSLVGGQADGWA